MNRNEHIAEVDKILCVIKAVVDDEVEGIGNIAPDVNLAAWMNTELRRAEAHLRMAELIPDVIDVGARWTGKVKGREGLND